MRKTRAIQTSGLPEFQLLHASCVAIDGHGIMLRGASGSGKSDLALRLIDRGAILVSDDVCEIRTLGDKIIATAPANIQGHIEVRGIGIVALPYITQTEISLIVDLVKTYPRMPDYADGHDAITGVGIARIALNAFEFSAPHKVALALARVIGD